MNLLPKQCEDFAQKDYWNKFFQKRGDKTFEWYGEYNELCGQLHKYIKVKDDILIVGCGNSKLGMDLYDVNFKKITNIDISQLVINRMNTLNKNKRPDMKFIQMDATEMKFNDENFSVVLDKGTLDALMPDDSSQVINTVTKYFSEITRVLRNNGRYICISLLQEHIIKFVVDYFPKNNWMFRVVRCFDAEENPNGGKKSKDSSGMAVFVVIATKFQCLPMKILEICMDGSEKMQRIEEADEVIEAIRSIQQTVLICKGLQRNSIVDLGEVKLDLYRPNNATPRFTVHIVDQTHRAGHDSFAVFLVRHGREVEWLFATPEGRRHLINTTKYNRLAIVSLHRGHSYIDDIKLELADSIRNLSLNTVKRGLIPFLAIDSDIGKRNTIFEGHSEISGDYIVEELGEVDDDYKTRRLIFLNNEFVVQSEACVRRDKSGDETKVIIDPDELACTHHVYMSIGANVVLNKRNALNSPKISEIAVIGLGGGGLCTYMRRWLSKANITAIEIDSAILSVATDFFGFQQDERLHVIIDDGINFIKKAAENDKSYHAILFDVDNKDPTVGMSCPPKEFLDPELLHAVQKCIGDDGLFILNLVCRNENLRKEIIKSLKLIFPSICSYKIEQELNEIIYCHNISGRSLRIWQIEIQLSIDTINKERQKSGIMQTQIENIMDCLIIQ